MYRKPDASYRTGVMIMSRQKPYSRMHVRSRRGGAKGFHENKRREPGFDFRRRRGQKKAA